ncbi:MAG: hypothetical protein WCP74_12030 [Sphingobacteriia bacterium]
MKQPFLVFILLLMGFILKAQTITYKSNTWGNTKLYKDWAKALDNPILEKVAITQTDKIFKINFGDKRSIIYTIVSFQKLSSTSVNYNVNSNNQKYSIKVSFIGNAYYIFCENEWVVAEITDMSSSN